MDESIVPDERPPSTIDGQPNPAYHAWYYQTHKQRALLLSKQWKEAHAEWVRDREARRRAQPGAQERSRQAQKRYYQNRSAKAKARAYERTRQWRARNKAYLSAYAHEYNTGHGKEARRAYNKKRIMAWSEAEKQANRARVAAWEKAHPERARASKAIRLARRRMLIQAALNTLTQDQWEMVVAVCKGRCVYCGKREATMDHLTPYTRGGDNTLHNVLPACKSCNSRKWAGPVLKPVQPFLL